MILSGHQPVYLPGIIFFNKMALSDIFMYVGHVQFSPKSWQQRNRVALNGQELFLTVPVRKADRFGQAIDQVELGVEPWRRKHLGTLKQAYSKRPFFSFYYPELEFVINQPYDNLGQLNRALISLIRGWLSIDTKIVESYDFVNISGAKTDMLIEMCKSVGASKYLSNEGARAYVDEEQMGKYNIQHYWQNFSHPIYPQGEIFLPGMTILDLIFNMGDQSSAIVRSSGNIFKGSVNG